jgi:hypothetical protein
VISTPDVIGCRRSVRGFKPLTVVRKRYARTSRPYWRCKTGESWPVDITLQATGGGESWPVDITLQATPLSSHPRCTGFGLDAVGRGTAANASESDRTNVMVRPRSLFQQCSTRCKLLSNKLTLSSSKALLQLRQSTRQSETSQEELRRKLENIPTICR